MKVPAFLSSISSVFKRIFKKDKKTVPKVEIASDEVESVKIEIEEEKNAAEEKVMPLPETIKIRKIRKGRGRPKKKKSQKKQGEKL